MLSRTSVVLAALLALTAAVPAALAVRTEDEPHSPLGQQMEKVEHGLKRLRRDLKDATKDESSLATVLEMQAAFQTCKVMAPPRAEKTPEADRAQFVTDYRKTIIAVEKDLLDLELALLDGDRAKAQELFRKIHDAEDPGHERFANDG